MAAPALADDLEAAQAQAIAAFALECRGDVRGAASAYAQARSQLQYLADVCIPSGQPDMVAACRCMLQVGVRGRAGLVRALAVGAPGAFACRDSWGATRCAGCAPPQPTPHLLGSSPRRR